jgi:hypothetical protein
MQTDSLFLFKIMFFGSYSLKLFILATIGIFFNFQVNFPKILISLTSLGCILIINFLILRNQANIKAITKLYLLLAFLLIAFF